MNTPNPRQRRGGSSKRDPAVPERFAVNLRRYRHRAGLSHHRLSVLTGLHFSEISKLENGQREPRLLTLVKLVVALEVSMDELTEGIGWRLRGSTNEPGLLIDGRAPDR